MGNAQTSPILVNTASGKHIASLLMIAGLLLLAPTLRADVTASLDRNSIYAGDTVTLSIATSGADEGRQPDLSPLRKDFDILGTSSSQQIEIINGQRSDSHQWLVELAPQNAGTLTVPALKVGNSHTPALTLTVSAQPAAAGAQAGAPVFVESELDTARGGTYVQQEIPYTTRLYYRVPLIEGDFSDPQLDNAAVERIGEDRQYRTTRDGEHYQVLERRYAIFPEHSGKLTIPPAVFTGRMVSASSQRSPFDSMDAMMERMMGGNPFKGSFFAGTPFADPGKRIRRHGNELSVDVKPRPASYRGEDWLPTPKLVLHDSWAESPPEFHSGEPVTRTITLEARGLEAAQLPEIHIPATPGLRIYPEQPVQNNRVDGDWVYGRSKQTFAFLATKAGRIDLPAISVHWWDTEKHTERTAQLPGWEVMVKPGSASTGAAAPLQPAAGQQPPAPVAQPGKPVAAGGNLKAADQTAAGKMNLWLVVGGPLLLVALLLTVLLARRLRQSGRGGTAAATETPPAPVPPTAATETREKLRRACADNDPHAAASALLDWARATWPRETPRSLGELAVRVGHGQAQVRELETVLYAPGEHAWSGERLWGALRRGLEPVQDTGRARHGDNDTPPLYPEWPRKAG